MCEDAMYRSIYIGFIVGADLIIGDESNRSPLNIAATYGHTEAAKLLIEAGTFSRALCFPFYIHFFGYFKVSFMALIPYLV